MLVAVAAYVPAAANDNQTHYNTVKDVLIICGPHLSLQDTARLVLSSKRFHGPVLRLIRPAGPSRLIQAVIAASNGQTTSIQQGSPPTPSNSVTQFTSAATEAANSAQLQDAHDLAQLLVSVRWLQKKQCKVTETKGVTEGLQALFSSPRTAPNGIPMKVALALASGGLRISYAQLVKAARNQVHHVEVWVQAQQQLNVQTDIPEAATAICCSDSKVASISMEGDELDDLLHLAINCSDRIFVNSVVADMLPTQLQQPLAVQLMETAILREHCEVVPRLIAMQAIQQLPADEACRLVIKLLREPGCGWVQTLVNGLPQLDTISCHQLLELMQAAIEGESWDGIILERLRKLPAAQLISPGELVELVKAAIQCQCTLQPCHGFCFKLVHELLEVPAIAQLSTSDLVELLQLALQSNVDRGKYIGGLLYSKCHLPAAAISAETVVQLLLAGATTIYSLFDTHRLEVIKGMCDAPATQKVSAEQFGPVLVGLVPFLSNGFHAERGVEMLQAFFNLPVAAYVSSDVVQQLLEALVEVRMWRPHEHKWQDSVPVSRIKSVWGTLCSFPAAQHLHEEALLQMMLLIKEHQADRDAAQFMLHKLCGLPTSRHFSVEWHTWLFIEAMCSQYKPAQI